MCRLPRPVVLLLYFRDLYNMAIILHTIAVSQFLMSPEVHTGVHKMNYVFFLSIPKIIYYKANKKVSCKNIQKCRDGAASH